MAGRLRHCLTRIAGLALRSELVGTSLQPQPALQQAGPAVLAARWRNLQTSAPTFATGTTDLTTEYEHVTGLEKQELESVAQGVNPWHEEWLDAPFGTPEKPVEVPSMFDHRVVGVPDPDDDSLVWWGIIEEGMPPKQIIDDGEYFVLKRVEGEGGHH